MNTNYVEGKKKYENTLIYKDEVFQVIGAAIEVHKQLGGGFLEAVYQEALEREFADRGIPFISQQELPILYKGVPLKKIYVADFMLFGKIIGEIKAVKELTQIDHAQVVNYLKATGVELGLLINFGNHKLEWSRILYTK